MNSKILVAILLLANISLVNYVKAQEPSNNEAAKANPVVDACIQNRAENLPNPFSDVPSDHWAFKAVMTMH